MGVEHHINNKSYGCKTPQQALEKKGKKIPGNPSAPDHPPTHSHSPTHTLTLPHTHTLFGVYKAPLRIGSCQFYRILPPLQAVEPVEFRDWIVILNRPAYNDTTLR